MQGNMCRSFFSVRVGNAHATKKGKSVILLPLFSIILRMVLLAFEDGVDWRAYDNGEKLLLHGMLR